METLKSIVLMIDADNTQLSKIENVIQEVSTYGRIVVKRAYGNWKKEALKNWENELKRLAIKAEQQFDYVSGKNATDIALVIDAINLLHKGIYDAFVIVASDSDYTPLAREFTMLLSLLPATAIIRLWPSAFTNPVCTSSVSAKTKRPNPSGTAAMNLSFWKISEWKKKPLWWKSLLLPRA